MTIIMVEKFDAIVVGAGFAGCSAAIKMSSNGINTLLIERGEQIGCKNITGGVLWGNELEKIIPNWHNEAPVERCIDRKKLTFLSHESAFTIDFHSPSWLREHNAYSILRRKMDPWLAQKAEDAGATVITGTPINSLAMDDKRVVGVMESGEITYADVVIIADGANSRLTLAHGLRKKIDIKYIALGIKEIIKMPKDFLEQRFGLDNKSGCATEYILGFLGNGVNLPPADSEDLRSSSPELGSRQIREAGGFVPRPRLPAKSVKAGGFMYTNMETISLGVVINLESLKNSNIYSHDIMEDFRNHPCVATMIKGGEVVEYSAHLIPEGGYNMIPTLYGDGFIVAGDAAGFCLSNGLLIQGLNYAITSGIIAGESVIEAKKKGDFSSNTLSSYVEKLNRSYVLKDMKRFRNAYKFIWNERMHHIYPHLLANVFNDIFTETGNPKDNIRGYIKRNLKKHRVGALTLLRDTISGGWNI